MVLYVVLFSAASSSEKVFITQGCSHWGVHSTEGRYLYAQVRQQTLKVSIYLAYGDTVTIFTRLRRI